MSKSDLFSIRKSRYVQFTFRSKLNLFLYQILLNYYHMWLNENTKSENKELHSPLGLEIYINFQSC